MIKKLIKYSTVNGQINVPMLVGKNNPVSVIYTPSGVYIQADYLPDESVFAQAMHIRTETVPALPAHAGKTYYIGKNFKKNSLSNTIMAVSKPLNTPLPLCDAAAIFNVSFTITFSSRDSSRLAPVYQFNSQRASSESDTKALQAVADSLSMYEVTIKAVSNDVHSITFAINYLNSFLSDEVFTLTNKEQPFILLKNETDNISFLHSEHIAFIPYHTDAFLFSPAFACEESAKLDLGKDIYSNTVSIDLADVKRSSTYIQGPSGYGKTNTMRILMSQIRKKDPEAVIITLDPVKQNELTIGGKVYTIGTDNGLKLNIFSVDKEETMSKKVSEFIDNASYILQADALLANIIKNAIYGVYKANKPVSFELIEASSRAYLKHNTTYKADVASHLAAMISLRFGSVIAAGVDDLFTTEDDTLFSYCFEKGSVTHIQFSTNIDIMLKELYISMLLMKVKNHVNKLRQQGQKQHIYLFIDELSDILNENKYSENCYGNNLSQQLSNLIKRIRYHGVSFILADQQKQNIFNHCSNGIVFRQISEDNNMNLTPVQATVAANLPRYQCLLSCATNPQSQFIYEIDIYKENYNEIL